MADDKSNPIDTARGGIALIADVIKAAGDSPHVKEAANNLGQTAVTLTKTINNVLVPLAAINFAFDKARAYFAGKFQAEIEEKARAIPPEHIVQPKPSIAGPTLQGLAFAHEEPDLKDLYLNLLATSMDGRKAAQAHPAFVEIIKQLDGRDAKTIRPILVSESPLPIAQIRRIKASDGSFFVLHHHLLDYRSETTGKPAEDEALPSMVDNWMRLGLVEVTYEQHLTNPNAYSWAEQRPEFTKLKRQALPEGYRLDIAQGLMRRTELGKRFGLAIGVIGPLRPVVGVFMPAT